MDSNWAPFTEQETAETLKIAGGFDRHASGQMFVADHTQHNYVDHLEADDCKRRYNELFSKNYFLTTREHTLQILLTDITMRCGNAFILHQTARQSRLNEKKQLKVRKSADALLKLLGIDSDGIIGPDARLMVSDQFSEIVSQYGSESMENFAAILFQLTVADFDQSPIGYLHRSRVGPIGSDSKHWIRSKPKIRILRIEDKMSRIETFYLCELWRGLFCRRLTTSVVPLTGKADGKLVRFIYSVEKCWRPSKKLTFDAIRDRIRRYAHTKGR